MSPSPSKPPELPRYVSVHNGLIALSVIVFLIAWNRGITLLYGMLAMLLAILAVSYCAPRFMLRGLRMDTHYPRQITAGESFNVALEITNDNRTPRSLIEVWSSFSAAPEGAGAHMSFLPLIRQQCSTGLTFQADYRGRHTLGPMVLKSAFPFGVHTAQRVVPDSSGEILVYPDTFAIDYFPYISGNHLPMLGVNAVAMTGGSDLFFGVREYRHGDNPRHVHWPSSARHQQLVVKEYQYVSATELTLVLDLHREADYGEGKHSTLEYAVTIAASLAKHALAEGHRVRLLGFGAETLDLPAVRSDKQLHTIMTALAEVRCDGDVPYGQALQRALAKTRPGSILVLFHVPAPGTTVLPDTSLCGAQHVKPVWVAMDSQSFLYPVQRRAGGTRWLSREMPVYRVHRGDNLAEIFTVI